MQFIHVDQNSMLRRFLKEILGFYEPRVSFVYVLRNELSRLARLRSLRCKMWLCSAGGSGLQQQASWITICIMLAIIILNSRGSGVEPNRACTVHCQYLARISVIYEFCGQPPTFFNVYVARFDIVCTGHIDLQTNCCLCPALVTPLCRYWKIRVIDDSILNTLLQSLEKLQRAEALLASSRRTSHENCLWEGRALSKTADGVAFIRMVQNHVDVSPKPMHRY
ncbi:hypothetical protein EVAR_86665_1 [Eumeta japonica]|uniref:Uncharacterized protein n=1 Tax=Eumeta variegata TaxID=151549 RepID=A0A4C1Z3Z9_EUMVA|nr:hypothetical protein EVAR_86665_1 [Eumeta japonica]